MTPENFSELLEAQSLEREASSTLMLAPWLCLEETGTIGPVTFTPGLLLLCEPGRLGITSEALTRLSARVTQDNAEILEHCTYLSFTGKRVGDPVTYDDEGTAHTAAACLAVAGLSQRDLIGPRVRYSASGHYGIRVFRFKEPLPRFIQIEYTQKCRTIRNLEKNSRKLRLPEHLPTVVSPEIDWSLANALFSAKTAVNNKYAQRLYDATTQFLSANSDSPDMLPGTEAKSTYAAIERLLGAKQDYDSFKHKVRNLFSTYEVGAEDLYRHVRAAGLSCSTPQAAIDEWARGLYSLRGHCAHGKAYERFTKEWSADELLIKGALAFPILLKASLAESGFIQLTGNDLIEIETLPLLLECITKFRSEGHPVPDARSLGWEYVKALKTVQASKSQK
jgi:hypothetical protein